MTIARCLLVLALLGAASAPSSDAAARPGTLDPSFGKHGKVFFKAPPRFAGSHFSGLEIQPDGRLVLDAWHDIANGHRREIERRLPDGSLDLSFGSAGETVVAGGRGLALRPDGAILVAAGCRGGLILLDATGTKDGGFGENGCSASVGFDIGLIALGGDGRILLAGAATYCPPCGHDIQPNPEVAVARLLPDGALDTSFGGDGVVLTHSELGLDGGNPSGLAQTDDGGVLVSGRRTLFHLTATGGLDPAFGEGGTVEVEGEGGIRAFTTLGDGRIVVASAPLYDYKESGDYVLAAYGADGSPDTGFGDQGTATVDVGPDDIARDLAPSADGGILLAGESGGGKTCSILCPYQPVLLRLTTGGALDPTYGGGDGTATLPSSLENPESGRYPRLEALAVGPGGEAFAAGGPSDGDAYAVARTADGSPQAGFGEGGIVIERHQLPGNVWPTGLAIQPNGHLSVAAEGDAGLRDFGGFLLALRPNGQPERRFGLGRGIFSTGARGRIEPAGRGRVIAWGDGHFLVRALPDGRADPSFGDEGLARLPKGLRARGVVAGRHGSATVVGRLAGRHGMAVYRLDRRGRPLSRFGRRGMAIASFGAKVAAEGRTALVDRRGRVTVAGWAGSAAVARLLPSGRLDRSFGRHGRRRILGEEASVGTQIVPFAGGVAIACTSEEIAKRSMAGLVRLNARGRRIRSFSRRAAGVFGGPPPIALVGGRQRLVVVTVFPRLRQGGVLLRGYRADGGVDRRFGRHGKARGAVNQHRSFQPVAAAGERNGRIVVVGSAGAGYVGNQAELLRFR